MGSDHPVLKALKEDELFAVWAALCVMTQDVHAPQDCLTEEQWAAAEKLYEKLTDFVDRKNGHKMVEVSPKRVSPSGRYIVSVFDGFDCGWSDCTKPIPLEEAQKVWNEKTRGGTEKTNAADIDYYAIFPAESS